MMYDEGWWREVILGGYKRMMWICYTKGEGEVDYGVRNVKGDVMRQKSRNDKLEGLV